MEKIFKGSQPEEVAEAVISLCWDAASLITGDHNHTLQEALAYQLTGLVIAENKVRDEF